MFDYQIYQSYIYVYPKECVRKNTGGVVFFHKTSGVSSKAVKFTS